MKRLFEENTICRLCLRVNEKAYKIRNTNHMAFIESIIRIKNNNYVLSDDIYVCYICEVLLAKCFNFAQTVWNAQGIICLLLETRDTITEKMLDHIDRHNNGLNPITLSSVVTYGNKTFNNSGHNNDSGDDGHTSTDIEEIESTDIEEVESKDVEEIDLEILVDKMKKKPKRKTNETENHLGLNSSSDENEKTVQFNLDEEEVEIGNICKETSDIFVDSLIEDAYDKPSPTRTTQKPRKLQINEKIRRTTKRFYPNEAKSASSTTNQKESKNKTDEIDEDYHHDSTSISTANENKCKKKSDEIDEDYHHDSTSIATANENKCKKKSDKIYEDYHHDSTSISTSNENKRKKKSDEIDEDNHSDDSDSTSSTANENKRKKKNSEIDEDYCPDSTSHSEDSDYDSYDDEGKPIRRPKDTRVYPMKCDHCDFVLPEKRDHYRHYQYSHPDTEYPYRQKNHVTCMACGKLVPRAKIRTHEDRHFPTRDFKCNVCPNKVFTDRVRWYAHMQVVHPKKTFTCDYCYKVFKTKTDIHRHIRIHTGIKPYKCHICDEAFAHSGNRIIHIRIKHQNYKDKPKTHEKPQKKRRKNTHCSSNKEVYDTSDDEPLINVATNPQRLSKTPSENSNVKPKRKFKKQGPIQNGIGESRSKIRRGKRKLK